MFLNNSNQFTRQMNKEKRPLTHFPCHEYPHDCMFQLQKMYEGEEMIIANKKTNYFIFFLSGKCSVVSSLFDKEELAGNEVLFLPRQVNAKLTAKEDAQMLIHTFANHTCNPIHCILKGHHMYSNSTANEVLYNCKQTIVPALIPYLDTVISYIQEGISNPAMWYLKHQEVMRIFTSYYNKDDLSKLFRPILHESIPFNSLVITHARKVANVQELADLCGYGLVNFRRIFSKQFGIPVYQWLQKEKSKQILYLLSETDTAINDIVNNFGFSSISNFNKFCRKTLGTNPSTIRLEKKIKMESEETFSMET